MGFVCLLNHTHASVGGAHSSSLCSPPSIGGACMHTYSNPCLVNVFRDFGHHVCFRDYICVNVTSCVTRLRSLCLGLCRCHKRHRICFLSLYLVCLVRPYL